MSDETLMHECCQCGRQTAVWGYASDDAFAGETEWWCDPCHDAIEFATSPASGSRPAFRTQNSARQESERGADPTASPRRTSTRRGRRSGADGARRGPVAAWRRIVTALAALAILSPVVAGCAPHRGKLNCTILLMKPIRYGAVLGWTPLYLNGWEFDLWWNACNRPGGQITVVKDPPVKPGGGFRDVQVILDPSDCTGSYTSDLSSAEAWWAAKIEVI